MMRRVTRRLRRHAGMTARRVTVRSQPPWYGWLLLGLVPLIAGYALGYWQFGVMYSGASTSQLQNENRVLQDGLVHMEQQLQVDRAAQSNLAREMAVLQEESMRLKEDVAFYQSILSESEANGTPKIHSVKLVRGTRKGEYKYVIMLMQSGRHQKSVQGSLRLIMNASQSGKVVSRQLDDAGQARGAKISFKYYRRVDGSFNVPEGLIGQTLQVEFVLTSARALKLIKSVNFPA